MRWILLCLALAASPAGAVQPDEMLADPGLEARARGLSQGLRCLVCRNENIDESNADLARDLRLLVRERLTAGDSDAEVIAYLVDRFGEYVLLKPPATGSSMVLWLAGPALLLVALGGALVYLRRRRVGTESAAAPLSDAERRRLAELLEE